MRKYNVLHIHEIISLENSDSYYMVEKLYEKNAISYCTLRNMKTNEYVESRCSECKRNEA